MTRSAQHFAASSMVNLVGAKPATRTPRYTESQLLPSANDIAELRAEINIRMPRSGNAPLNRFIEDVFADDELVQSFFLPVGPQLPGGQSPVMPLDLCERDARRAWGCSVLLHRHEREMAAAAAFVHACGYYWCIRVQILNQQSPAIVLTPRANRARIATANRGFLEEPLRQLRRSHPEVGQTLTQVLAIGAGDLSDADTQQVARVQAALGMVHLQVH